MACVGAGWRWHGVMGGGDVGEMCGTTLSRDGQKARLMAEGRSGHMGRFLNLERGKSEKRRKLDK